MPLHNFSIVDAIAFSAVVMNVIVYLMKTMIPLRMVAMTTNTLFIVYSIMAGIYPTLILNCILFPLNALRLYQMKRLVRRVAEARVSPLSLDWLRPFTTKRLYAAGQRLFVKGDVAKEMFFLVSGKYRLRELGIELNAGHILGELGLLAPGNARTQTVDCIEPGEVLVIAYDSVMELYFQNPDFGFYFLQLSTARLFHTIKTLEEENAQLRAGQTPASLPEAAASGASLS